MDEINRAIEVLNKAIEQMDENVADRLDWYGYSMVIDAIRESVRGR